MPIRSLALSVSMIFMATTPASVIVAGMERSTLPGPVVITIIWPRPMMMVKVAKERAAVRISPEPWPRVKAMVASHTAIMAMKDQIQGCWRSFAQASLIAAPRRY